VSDLLLQEFDRVAQAPGGVARLRGLILSLAVRGKLVPQVSSDEMARETLKRIRDERERLISAGVIKEPKKTKDAVGDELPFEIPSSWTWVPLAELVRVLNGRAYSKQELLDAGPTPVLRVGNLFTSDHWYYSNLRLDPDKLCNSGDLLFAWSASFGPFIWDGPEAIFHYHIWKLDPIAPRLFDTRFFHLFLREKTAELKAAGHGVSMVHLTKERMEKIPVPWPPLAEQSRIVARVEELMRLCDALEAKGRLEAEQHTRLLDTLLGTLTDSATPEELAANWQRVAEHFDLLLDRPEAVDVLEQTILQLAVRGLLVPQEPSDEPASVLMEQVRTARARQQAEGTARSARADLPPVHEEEWPFAPPQGWLWIRFGEVAHISSGVTLGRKGAIVSPLSLPYLRVANVQRWRVNVDAMKEVTIGGAELARYQLKSGDLLITEGGDWDKVGRTAIWRCELPICLHQNHVFKARPYTANWNPQWAELFLNLDIARAYFAASAKQTTNLASINMTELRNCVMALPPLAEQSRIVARVSELRRLCAELRQCLSASQVNQSRLAEALVESVASA
jgi:type I restriction enzyme S subunit